MLTPIQQRRHLATIGEMLTEIARHLPAASAALRDAQPGYPTAAGGSGSRSSGLPSGLDRFVTAADPAAHDARRLDTALSATLRQCSEIHSVVMTWAKQVGPEGQPTIERARTRSGGECLACGVYCSGTYEDRLRSGLCDACRHSLQRWMKAGGTDRGEWISTRRRERDEEAGAA